MNCSMRIIDVIISWTMVRGCVNREVQTVNWEARKKGIAETGIKSGLKKANKPWSRGKNNAQTS